MSEKNEFVPVRIGCAVLVIIFSMGTAFLLWKFKPETETREPEEAVLAVEQIPAVSTNLTVLIETQGIAKPLREVVISPQVGGRVIDMPRNLKAGDLVEKDELLVKIDPVDYETSLAEAKAAVARTEAGINMLQINREADSRQLKLSQRSRDLARKEFERAKKLSEEGQAVSVAVVESAERALTQAESQVLQLEQSLAQFPEKLQEMQSELASANARMKQSALQLERTEIRAPFSGRILSSSVEAGEILNPGTPVFELADDSELEIEVAVTASDLRAWIPFEEGKPSSAGWFPPLKQVPVTVRWSESSRDLEWSGRLDRLIRFDATTRTALLAVRVGGEALNSTLGFPLTGGMFCQVDIPGKTLEGVIALPRVAVTFDNQSYLNVEGRLTKVDVTVARSQGDRVYVSEGIREGDQVIITRLVAPLEGIKLEVAGVEE